MDLSGRLSLGLGQDDIEELLRIMDNVESQHPVCEPDPSQPARKSCEFGRAAAEKPSRTSVAVGTGAMALSWPLAVSPDMVTFCA
jgi:hypothetical protein